MPCRRSCSTAAGSGAASAKILETYKTYLQTPLVDNDLQTVVTPRNAGGSPGQTITVHGYLGAVRRAGKALAFAELHDLRANKTLQLVEARKGSPTHHLPGLGDLSEHTPVSVTGTLQPRKQAKDVADETKITDVELRIDSVTPLNSMDAETIMTKETVFPPEQRHLQIRHNANLMQALELRSKVTNQIRTYLCSQAGFTEVETPLLFKSTPEGAREFLVPTRTAGLVYALPQSPQQYKQILMASGIQRYMQIARCFRDEDLRADRQPEFTQVDMEMAFADSSQVMAMIEGLIGHIWTDPLPSVPFQRMSYQNAMAKYGSDKPDLRFGSEIRRVDEMLPPDLVSKISDLSEPAVDVFKMSIADSPRRTSEFIRCFMESPEAQPFMANPAGQPGIFIFNSTMPLQGLQPLGFDAAMQLSDELDLTDGDVLIAQARKDEPFSGGSTVIGNLRLAMHKAAVKQGLLPAPEGFKFLWIVDFPLFTASSDSEPGQGGSAGLSATHHPFTSPKTPGDVDLLLTDPIQVIADHYDLVVNGVELGGGSRRIHNADMQELIMRDVLKMSGERINDFSHLLGALRSGCPPHAGIALGLDRLLAVMLGKDSVRDVIAFPKSGRGEDLMVKSPSVITPEQLDTYHLQLKG